ncbi:hypothetical protein TanjilG_11235 [Lupinus angustifolius]|uniref:Uncharacterized protein n=1 Tax=Lupinus angustifolius TaxID=3871 RepID=A0A1J7HKS4_LUPAN|nr:hypothetical protein TanjilG_11235 [Lupinus angustifolius]
MSSNGQSSGANHYIMGLICNAGAGAAAGAIAATFVCPLDVIKTRLQVHGLPPAQKGSIIITSLQNIFKTEGFRGMYRGLSPTILALLPNWAPSPTYLLRILFTIATLQIPDLLTTPLLYVLNLIMESSFATMVPCDKYARCPSHGISHLKMQEEVLVPQLPPLEEVYFTVYEQLKGLLRSHGEYHLRYGSNELTTVGNIISAAGAGAATAISTNPLWVVKTRLQTQGMRPDVIPYKSILSALTRITHEEGMRGLYSGIVPSLAGISHVAIQFPAYEKIKSYIAKKDNTTVDKLSPGNVAVASSISKVVASVMTYPHEVIRSRLQEQGHAKSNGARYAGVIDCTRKVFQKEGVPGFYRGCATNLLRTTPSAVITFTSYEMIHRFLQRVIPQDKKGYAEGSRQ